MASKLRSVYSTMLFAAFLSLVLSRASNSMPLYLALTGAMVFVLVVLPKDKLIPFALSVYAFCPINYITLNPIMRLLSPVLICLAVIVIRNLKLLNPNYMIMCAFPVIAMLLYQTTYSLLPSRSLCWIAVFSLALLSFGLNFDGHQQDIESIEITARALIVTLTSLGIVEFILKTSLIYGKFGLPIWTIDLGYRQWSVYRIWTTLGHPLNNAAFVSTLGLYLLALSLNEKIKWNNLACLVLGYLFVVLTGSRNSLIAMAIGSIIILLSNSPVTRYKTRIKISFIFTLAVSAASQPMWHYLVRRNMSAEGQTSYSYRFSLVNYFYNLQDTIPTLGYGPSTSTEVFATYYGFSSILESGPLMLTLSLGIPITLLLLVLGITGLVFVYKSGKSTTWIFLPIISSLAFTNFLEQNQPFISFVALVALMIKILNSQNTLSTELINSELRTLQFQKVGSR